MRLFSLTNQAEAKKIMRDIGVDPYGIGIMAPKALSFAVLLKNISNISANIIKQEMLSFGADAAVTRGALTGKVKNTDVLIIATLAQFNSLVSKLKFQPFGLNKLGIELDTAIDSYFKNNFILHLRNCSLHLGKKPRIMGIINLTPDSFSGDGLYFKGIDYLDLALKKAKRMESEGADIIDLGGQSSRPGSKSVSLKEELKRVIPAVRLLAKETKLPISIDTLKPEVAQAAFDSGAEILNDISGLRNNKMLKIAVKYKAAVIIMHMLGNPRTMQKIISYQSLIDDIVIYLKNAIARAQASGISPDKIVIDPGIGFGKTVSHNLQLIKRLSDFKVLGKPILVGLSRKSFIASVLGDSQINRLTGTMAACVMATQAGANILRVHDVKEISASLKMAEAIKNADK
ncbi:MAG: dihydropteroate synthase [Candidatus Omnitrophota bacterium]